MGYFEYKPKSDPINWDWGVKRPNNDGWWYNASCNFNLTQEDVRIHQNNIRWYGLSENRRFPFDDDFLAEFEDCIKWHEYCNTHRISEKTFLRFRKHIDIYTFLTRTSENKRAMAEKYFEQADDVGEYEKHYYDKKLKTSERQNILQDVTLPEKFYADHCKSKDDWYSISRCAKLSLKFIKKHWKELNKSALLDNYKIDDEAKEEISMMVLG